MIRHSGRVATRTHRNPQQRLVSGDAPRFVEHLQNAIDRDPKLRAWMVEERGGDYMPPTYRILGMVDDAIKRINNANAAPPIPTPILRELVIVAPGLRAVWTNVDFTRIRSISGDDERLHLFRFSGKSVTGTMALKESQVRAILAGEEIVLDVGKKEKKHGLGGPWRRGV